MIKRKLTARALLMLITLSPLMALAATGGNTQMLVTPQQKQALDLFKWIIGIAFSGQLFWIVKYMKDNEKKHDSHVASRKADDARNHETHEKQWEAIGNLAKGLAHLQGSHEANVGQHRRVEDPPEEIIHHTRSKE